MCQIVTIDYSQARNIQDQYNFNYSELQEGDDLEADESPKFLNTGFLDVFSSGTSQATVEIVKLYIGEPDKFKIPLYLFVSASGNTLGKEENNENTLGNLLNPLGGILNGTLNKRNRLFHYGKYTSLHIGYQASGKLISGENMQSEKLELFGSGFANAGLEFQTGAWESSNSSNMGVFWLHAKIAASFNGDSQMQRVFGDAIDDTTFAGYAIDLGIQIDGRINLKAGVYQYWGNKQVNGFNDPVFKFSFDYTAKKKKVSR